jgi:hypothetical protein
MNGYTMAKNKVKKSKAKANIPKYVWVARCNFNIANYKRLRYPFIGMLHHSVHDGVVRMAYRRSDYNYFCSEMRDSEIRNIITTFLVNGCEEYVPAEEVSLNEFDIKINDFVTLVGVEQDDDPIPKDYVLIEITPPKKYLEAFQHASFVTLTETRTSGRSVWMYNYKPEENNTQPDEEEDEEDEFDYED